MLSPLATFIRAALRVLFVFRIVCAPCLSLILFCACASVLASAAPKPPNLIIILADDMGYGDLSCYGHPSIHTPHLDQMAAEGLRLTDFYVAACVCTPSRAGLLTGRYPIRSGMAGNEHHRVIFRNDKGGLPPGEITIASALKSNHYATACIGKWHVGHQLQNLPLAHGFDFYYGLRWSNDMEPAPGAPRNASGRLDQNPKWWNASLVEGNNVIEQPTDLRTLTRRYTEQAVHFIHENRKHRFFLYFAHNFPHVPLFASAAFRGKSERGLYGDAVEELDWSVGEVLKTLQKEGLAENTLVFFTSDNGPWLIKDMAGGSAGLLRDGKGSTWEGGMREPAIAWWPGKIQPGRVSHEIACSLDLFPTLLKLANVPLPADRVIDGVDMGPLLFGTGPSLRNSMIYYRGDKIFAVRKGPYKAHFETAPGYARKGVKFEFQKHDPPLLFNLDEDPGESFDIASEHPDVIASIQKELQKHLATIQPVQPQY